MKVNPVFGLACLLALPLFTPGPHSDLRISQGCTKACIGAVTLNSHLLRARIDSGSGKDRLSANFSDTFFLSHAAKIEAIW